MHFHQFQFDLFLIKSISIQFNFTIRILLFFLFFFLLQDEKAQLHTYRSSMLRLNASVHSWLTRHEKRKQMETTTMNKITTIGTVSSSGNQDENGNSGEESTLESSTITIKEVSTSNGVGTSIDTDDCAFNEDLHKQLKNEVGNMYKVWDEADERWVSNALCFSSRRLYQVDCITFLSDIYLMCLSITVSVWDRKMCVCVSMQDQNSTAFISFD